MTVGRRVVSRFEVRAAAAGELDGVERGIRAAATDAGVSEVECRRVERPPLLDVRLTGGAPAVARVRAGLGGRVLRDAVMDPARAPRDRPYPDPLVSARIAPEGDADSPAGADVTVAVVDSGLMVEHPDLAGHLWTGPRSIHGGRRLGDIADDDVTDGDGHGTMLAGTVLAAAGGRGVQLMAVKFWDAAHVPGAANAARAIDFARRHGAAIIDLSWDLGLGSEALRQAIESACDAGALVVIAAGNNGTDNDRIPSVPSCYASGRRSRTITVMATDRYDAKAGFSNYGRESVDLAAPGVGIVSTHPFVSKGDADLGRRYRVYQGTSAAAAHVAGAAARLKSLNPSMPAEDIKARLVRSVDRRPGLRCISQGRLNVDRAARGLP